MQDYRNCVLCALLLYTSGSLPSPFFRELIAKREQAPRRIGRNIPVIIVVVAKISCVDGGGRTVFQTDEPDDRVFSRNFRLHMNAFFNNVLK